MMGRVRSACLPRLRTDGAKESYRGRREDKLQLLEGKVLSSHEQQDRYFRRDEETRLNVTWTVRQACSTNIWERGFIEGPATWCLDLHLRAHSLRREATAAIMESSESKRYGRSPPGSQRASTFN